MILALEHLDLLMLDPDCKIESIKPKAFRLPEDLSKRGEMTRIIPGILRQASERVEKALQDPNNDFGRLAPSVVNRIKSMIVSNPSLREEQKAIMLSDDVIPL